MNNVTDSQSTAEQRAQLAERLGVEEAAVGEEVTLSKLRDAVEGEISDEFASMGELIRHDLEGTLDAELIDEVLSDLETQIDRLEGVREAGIPDGTQGPEPMYEELVEPGWRLYDHLLDVGFFESIDRNAPRFSAEHIRNTGHGLIEADPLTAELESVGFSEQEQLGLMASVVNSDKELARWVPTNEIPYEVEFDVDSVPPLHQRAAGGVLLWIQTLDIHLWQKEILITEEILDDAYWDSKGMLGGLYLLALAAREIAAEESSLTDGQLMAALTGGAAMMIVKQQDVCHDVFYITEDMRAEPQAR
ncbi:MAG: hypothetical protein PPP58_08315 [Natronomonas sp.]